MVSSFAFDATGFPDEDDSFFEGGGFSELFDGAEGEEGADSKMAT